MWAEVVLQIENKEKELIEIWRFNEPIEYNDSVITYHIKLKNNIELIKYVFKDYKFKKFKSYLIKLDKDEPERTIINFLKIFFKNKSLDELLNFIFKNVEDENIIRLFKNLAPEYII